MTVGSAIKAEYKECVQLITTDRKLQSFMLCVFSILALVIYCGFNGLGFGPAASYYQLSEEFLSGNWDYDTYGMNLPPLVIPVLLIIKILSPDYDAFCVLLSLSGFAFYMLGGHFLLKMCRETGYPEKDAFLLLLLMFVCTLTALTTGIATISVSLVVISLWLYRRGRIFLSFAFLALATWTGFYPALLFIAIFFMRLRRRELKVSSSGIIMYVLMCIPLLLLIPHLHLSEMASYESCRTWISDQAIETLAGSVGTGATLCLIFSICVRREVSDARPLALILLISVLMLSWFYPYNDDYWTVTIFMLYILSRMGSAPGPIRNRGYVVITIYGLAEFITDFFIVENGLAYTAVSLISFVAVFLLVTFAITEYGDFSELYKKRIKE